MNKVQSKFRKEMSKAEKKQFKKARRNKGVFSNKLFLLRFYGYDGLNKERKNIFVKLLVIVFKVLKFFLMLIFILFLVILAVALFGNFINN